MVEPKLIIDVHEVPFTDTFAAFLDTVVRSLRGSMEFLLLFPDNPGAVPEYCAKFGFKVIKSDIQATKLIMDSGKDQLCSGIITVRSESFSFLSGSTFLVQAVVGQQDITELLIRQVCDNLRLMQQKFPAKVTLADLVVEQTLKMLAGTPSGNTPHDVASLADLVECCAGVHNAGLEVAFAAFVKLIRGGYFQAPVLAKVIDAGLVSSMDELRALVTVSPTEKLGAQVEQSFPERVVMPDEDKKENRLEGWEEEEEKKSESRDKKGKSGFTPDEEEIVVLMLEDMVLKFVENCVEKGWTTIAKLTSLRKHFANQLGTFPTSHLKVAVLNKLKSDANVIDFLVEKIIKILENQGYIKLRGGQVEYNVERFRKMPNRLEFEDFKAYLYAAPTFGGSQPLDKMGQLRKDICDVAQYVRDHFVNKFLGCGWSSINKTESLREHFANQIRQISNKVIVSENLEPIKARADFQKKIVDLIMKSLEDAGLIEVNLIRVKYNMQLFEGGAENLPEIVLAPHPAPAAATTYIARPGRAAPAKNSAVVALEGIETPHDDLPRVAPKPEKKHTKEQVSAATKLVIAKIREMGKVPTTIEDLYQIVNFVIKDVAGAKGLAQKVVDNMFKEELVVCTVQRLNGADILNPASKLPIKFKKL